MWEAGDTLHVYELLAPILGTRDKLWRARHTLNQSSVIVKRLEDRERGALQSLFERRLASPRLIAFIDLGDDFAVMEDGGETLQARLDASTRHNQKTPASRDRKGADSERDAAGGRASCPPSDSGAGDPVGLAPEDRAPIVRELFRALSDLHGAGIVHGDLKPLNVLVAENAGTHAHPEIAGAWRVRLIDFGLATEIPADDFAHTLALTQEQLGGTPLYLDPAVAKAPPDELDARRRDPRADLYAAGIVAHEILFGQPPTYGAPLPAWLTRCVGPWDDRFVDAEAASREIEREDIDANEAESDIAREADVTEADATPALAARAPQGKTGALGERARALASKHRGRPPIEGAPFLELYAELQEAGLLVGHTRDSVRALIVAEAEHWRAEDARKKAERAEKALWKETESASESARTPGEAADAYGRYLTRTNLGRHRDEADDREAKLRSQEAAARASETAVWEAASAEDTIEAFEHYLKTSERGTHRGTAARRIREIRDAEDWSVALEADSEDGYEQYLAGDDPRTHRVNAQQRLLELREPAAVQAFEAAAHAGTLKAWTEFLDAHSESTLAEKAERQWRACRKPLIDERKALRTQQEKHQDAANDSEAAFKSARQYVGGAWAWTGVCVLVALVYLAGPDINIRDDGSTTTRAEGVASSLFGLALGIGVLSWAYKKRRYAEESATGAQGAKAGVAARLSRVDADLVSSLPPAERTVLLKLPERQRGAVAVLPVTERDAFLGLSESDRADFLGLPDSQRATVAALGASERGAFMKRNWTRKRVERAILSAEDARMLDLDWLERLDAPTAEKLAAWGKGKSGMLGLSLDSVTALDAETAEKLARWGRDDSAPGTDLELLELSLNGLDALNARTAAKLAEWGRGDSGIRLLRLEGLKTLDASTRRALSRFEGDIECPALDDR